MLKRLQKLKAGLEERYPETELKPLTAKVIASLKQQYPDVPDHLVKFFQTVGCGNIGKSRYMLYPFMGPDEVYDKETAADLDGVVLIGDDYAGNNDGYHTKKNWRFGSIGADCRFVVDPENNTIIDFLEAFFLKE